VWPQLTTAFAPLGRLGGACSFARESAAAQRWAALSRALLARPPPPPLRVSCTYHGEHCTGEHCWPPPAYLSSPPPATAPPPPRAAVSVGERCGLRVHTVYVPHGVLVRRGHAQLTALN
jgi:hypothetical protein